MPYWEEPIPPDSASPGAVPELKPWALRERVSPLRTYSGRVVYDRKPHRFTIRDVERITSKVDLQKEVPERLYSFWEYINRFLVQLIFAIVPLPDWLSGLPDIITRFWVNFVYDQRVNMSIPDAFVKNARPLVMDLIDMVWGNLAKFVQQEGGNLGSQDQN